MEHKKKNAEQLFDIPIFTPQIKGKFDEFYEKNKKTILYVISFIAIAVIGFFGYKNFIIKPQDQEAQGLIFMAQNYFQADSFEKALNGNPPNVYGFVDIVSDYGKTPTGNLAKYYAGLCYLHLGNYEEAIDYLKKYKTNSVLLKPMALGALGDAYSQLKEYDKAVKCYHKAAKSRKNTFTTPYYYFKAALVMEELQDFEKAISTLEKIKKEFPKSQEAAKADKYIGRCKAKSAN